MDINVISQKLAHHRENFGRDILSIPIRPLRTESGMGDGTAIYMVGDEYLLHLSPASYPQVAEEQRAAIVEAKSALPESLARHIIDIVDHGEMDGRSWILQPRLTPFSSNTIISKMQRLHFRSRVLQWLQQLACLSSVSVDATEQFQQSLSHLADMANLPAALRLRAHNGLALIADGSFRPYSTPMHGDLWRGNVLIEACTHFVVIDWRGSKMNGYGIFDLIRYAQSEGLRPRRVRDELQAHASASGIECTHTNISLLAALGHFARHLGQFPESRFIEMAASCHDTWDRAMA